MSLTISTGAPCQPASSLAEWARVINALAAPARDSDAPVAVGHRPTAAGPSEPGHRAARPGGALPLLACGPRRARGRSDDAESDLAAAGYRMAPSVAEHLVADGLDPGYLNHLAAASGLEPRDLLEFAGIDRTTVSRRQASGAALPPDSAIKALQATDLVTRATEVFGSPAVASAWLSKAHPLLDGQTPLQRARTPWGMEKVLSMLVALRFGSAA